MSDSLSAAEYAHEHKHDNIYGQVIPKESPDLLSSSITDLDKSLEEIPLEEKEAWLKALEQCPEQCGEKFKLMFLRCEIFDSNLAAKRIVKYWTKRVELFTESKAFLPLTLGDKGALKDDEESLKVGLMRLVSRSDDAGRPLLFYDPSRIPPTYNRISMVRAFWYYMHAAIIYDEIAQRKGCVFFAFTKNLKFSQFDRELSSLNINSMKGFLPIRISAFHICHPPTFFNVVFPIMKVLMGAKLRKKIKKHTGSDENIAAKFEKKYGIPSQDLPIELSGGVTLDHETWLQKRKEQGL